MSCLKQFGHLSQVFWFFIFEFCRLAEPQVLCTKLPVGLEWAVCTCICVCIRACICGCVLYMCAPVYGLVGMYFVCVCTCVCMCARTCGCALSVCACVCMYACTYVYMYLCVRILCVCVNACVHTHTQLCSRTGSSATCLGWFLSPESQDDLGV